ncbi:stage III sporulation protein AG [Tepidanaerobacter sp. GT38]|uniref:stage III sporulation protein AG n=1 Tax=Tepidanaerobacter sp. GT38 TaxID=2722793 RepID=UPI001F016CF1|nr:stage III sporulation protein AG [Tepidanaerobacter sp. GT38]MCG1012686.1 stage III sporulation protein AG [Tepidanaerobacter sp. GT38]
MASNNNLKTIIEWIKNPKNKIISKFMFLFTLGLLLLSLGKFLTASDNLQSNSEYLKSSDIIEQNMAQENISYEDKLERQLTELLRQVKGVGDVSVMITLEDETLIEPAFNTVNTEKTSEEKDNEGGVRTIIEKQTNQQVVLLRRNGEEEAVVLKKTAPKIKGVLIVADGASSSNIREKIMKSTATLLDIPIYKISVLEK